MTTLSEKNLDNITIKVPDACASYDIIISFYGLITRTGNMPDWQYKLEYIKCCDFFGIKLNFSTLSGLVVPVYGLPVLFDFVLLMYDRNIGVIGLLEKNMPKDYDITKLNKKLDIELQKFNNYKLVSLNASNVVNLWNYQDGKLIKKINLVTGNIVICSNISPSGKKIINCDDIGNIGIYDIETYNNFNKIETGNNNIYFVSFMPDNKNIIYTDNCINIYNVDSKKIIKSFDHGCSVNCVTVFDNMLVGGDRKHNIKILNFETGQLIRTFVGHNEWVISIIFSLDGKRIISGSFDKTIKIWNAQNGNLDSTLNGHTDWVRCVAISPDG